MTMGIATVFVEDSFDAAHNLPFVPIEHKCHRLHGHTYKIRMEVTGGVSRQSGWVIDYDAVKTAWLDVKAKLDHQYLNEIRGLENPTCELLAAWISDALKDLLPGLSSVELRETERCGVWVNSV